MKKVLAILAMVLIFAGIAYALTELDELDDHLAQTDIIPTVDVSDTTQAGSGTAKKLEYHNLLKQNIVAKTSTTYSVTVDDCGTIFTNAGAGNNVEFDCPECDADNEGWWVAFYVMDDDHTLYIDPHANDSIKGYGFSGANGEHIYASTLGYAIKLQCMLGDDSDYDLYSMGYLGSWTG